MHVAQTVASLVVLAAMSRYVILPCVSLVFLVSGIMQGIDVFLEPNSVFELCSICIFFGIAGVAWHRLHLRVSTIVFDSSIHSFLPSLE
jgi:hypothetical protein